MNVAKPIYVIGHRNPDTDSICSAVGYAHLKQAMGVNAVAARAGKLNKETKFVLEYFHVEQPLLIPDLYPRVKDIAMDCKIVVRQHDTLRNLGASAIVTSSARRTVMYSSREKRARQSRVRFALLPAVLRRSTSSSRKMTSFLSATAVQRRFSPASGKASHVSL